MGTQRVLLVVVELLLLSLASIPSNPSAATILAVSGASRKLRKVVSFKDFSYPAPHEAFLTDDDLIGLERLKEE
ncbi:MAG TPA: hypothetical protein VKB06_03380 [Nitrososphaera sp.]|nr:hypothetical protein [Nitrososphaera sp.]